MFSGLKISLNFKLGGGVGGLVVLEIGVFRLENFIKV